MNIEQAKTIPLSQILDKLNFKPTRVSGHDSYYISPFRNEKTASFHVDTNKNVWYDHGDPDLKGDSIRFVQEWLKYSGVDYSVSDALRWIANMFGLAPRIAPVKEIYCPSDDPILTITRKEKIKHPALVQYLQSRGIPLQVADPYLQEVSVYSRKSRKSIFALGFKNDKGGYELRNAFYKGSTKPKYITFIRGTEGGQGGAIHIFEGWTDYLSALIQQNNGRKFRDDAIIVNSLSILSKATPYIKGYGYRTAYTWMDNDEPGKQATANLAAFFATEDNLRHQPMNAMYAPYKDVNAWHMVKLGLTG